MYGESHSFEKQTTFVLKKYHNRERIKLYNSFHIMPNYEELLTIAQGLSTRTRVPVTISIYLSKMKVMTEILNRDPRLRRESLILDEYDQPTYYQGAAKKIMKLKLPISTTTATLLFAAIAVDDNLPKKKRRLNERESNDRDSNEDEIDER